MTQYGHAHDRSHKQNKDDYVKDEGSKEIYDAETTAYFCEFIPSKQTPIWLSISDGRKDNSKKTIPQCNDVNC